MSSKHIIKLGVEQIRQRECELQQVDCDVKFCCRWH